MKEYLRESKDVLQEQQTSENGLSESQAKERLEAVGENKLAEAEKVSLFSRFIDELKDPMIIILIVAAIISGITASYSGEGYADVIIIMVVVIINSVLGVYQENKAEQAIDALAKMSAPTSKVRRDGHVRVVPSTELVPGDIVLIEAGDAVPADGRVIECASLKIEESALTGESVPVTKTTKALAADGDQDIVLGDRKNMVYMGSNVSYGRGEVVIVDTGMKTEMGKIADALAKAKDDDTPLQIQLNQLSKILSYLVVGICVFIFALDVVRSYPNITGEGMLDTFMVAVSLAVAAIPEGLAAVVTIVLSMGVTKMSRRNAIIRRLTAVETLGCTQVICSDKTGTLTQNKMTVVDTYTNDKKKLANVMSMCNDCSLDENDQIVGEPTEAALFAFGMQEFDMRKLQETQPRVKEAPFDSMRKMMSTVHQAGDQYIQFTKGAPDEILKCCTTYYDENGKAAPLDDKQREVILANNKKFADQALRVLAAAERIWKEIPESEEASYLEQDLCFIGLTGMIDPVREEVKPAIEVCKEAGIRTIMITGDHKDTAVAIAKQLGIIENEDEAITGTMLNQMSDEELQKNIKKYSVYARVQPEHKVRIVNAWKQEGMITAMTGDGVNDAPSIKSADIGIGMGITGTDVTKNVADMVLADDNFATIVYAVEEGRRIYDNIRKSIQFLLSSNLAEVISVFVATLFGFTILEPVHLLWINLITDSLPALALGMEEAESDVMKREPRSSTDGIFANGLGVDTLIQGVMISILTLVSYAVGHYYETGVFELVTSQDGMTMAFLTLSIVELFHSFNMRSRTHSIFSLKKSNKYLWLSLLVALILTSTVIFIPALSNMFGFAHISLTEYAIAMGLAILIIPMMEIYKKIIKRKA